MKRFNRTHLVVGLLVAFVILLALVLTRHNDTALATVHRGDPSPVGGRGLSLVMEKLGFATRSASEPLQAMPSDARVWFLLDPNTRFSDREADLLLGWVHRGGTLVWACAAPSRSMWGGSSARPGLDHLNAPFSASSNGSPSFNSNGLPQMTPLSLDAVSNYRVGVASVSAPSTPLELNGPSPHLDIAGSTGWITGAVTRVDWGKGQIFFFPDAWMLSNYGLSQPSNATFIANLVRVHIANPSGGAVYFDERQHDNTLAAPAPDDWPARLRQRPVVFAVWQLIVVGLGALALVSRRLGSPVALPSQAPVTRASGFARAMGGLLLKAGRPKAAAQIIGESFRARLARRIGLSPRESDEVLGARAHEISGIPRETLSRALIASRAPATDETSALRDAQLMERILEELG